MIFIQNEKISTIYNLLQKRECQIPAYPQLSLEDLALKMSSEGRLLHQHLQGA